MRAEERLSMASASPLNQTQGLSGDTSSESRAKASEDIVAIFITLACFCKVLFGFYYIELFCVCFDCVFAF